MPGRMPLKSLFIACEPQEEALARIDYLRERGGGWCQMAGPPGIGKTSLLAELRRRAQQRGERPAWLSPGWHDASDWCAALADAWQVDVPRTASASEVRRRIEDHLSGCRAMNQTVWLLVDEADGAGETLARGCRWLRQTAERIDVPLMIVTSRRIEADAETACDDADVRFELWPWQPGDCLAYVQACCRVLGSVASYSPPAIGALCERTGGIPREMSRLIEWSLAAAEAESLADVGPELIHAVADELSPRETHRPDYETSAAYGAW